VGVATLEKIQQGVIVSQGSFDHASVHNENPSSPLLFPASLVLSGCQTFTANPNNSLYLQWRAAASEWWKTAVLIVDDTRKSSVQGIKNVAQVHAT